MSTIKIPTPLRQYVGENSSVEVSGETVGEALTDLLSQHSDIKDHLFDGDELRSFVNIYLNKEDIRHLDGQKTKLSETDQLMIIPSIAGGK